MYSVWHTCQGASGPFTSQYILLVVSRIIGRRLKIAAALPLLRGQILVADNHTHTAFGIEDRRRMATTCIDISAQCPRLAIGSPTRQSWPFWRDEPFLLASRTVGSHVERRNLHARRRIGTGDEFQAFGNRGTASLVAPGEEIADHAGVPRYVALQWFAPARQWAAPRPANCPVRIWTPLSPCTANQAIANEEDAGNRCLRLFIVWISFRH